MTTKPFHRQAAHSPLGAPAHLVTAAVLVSACVTPSGGPEDAIAPPPSRFQCTGTPRPCGELDEKSCSPAPGCRLVTACHGAPTPCGQLLQASCPRQSGCRWAPRCMGQARGCDTFAARGACERQPGCAWRPEEERCEGEVPACAHADLATCPQVRGCYVGGACSGTAEPCGTRQGLDCERQRGCVSNLTCAGQPVPCQSRLEAAACASAPGCRWCGDTTEDPNGGG